MKQNLCHSTSSSVSNYFVPFSPLLFQCLCFVKAQHSHIRSAHSAIPYKSHSYLSTHARKFGDLLCRFTYSASRPSIHCDPLAPHIIRFKTRRLGIKTTPRLLSNRHLPKPLDLFSNYSWLSNGAKAPQPIVDRDKDCLNSLCIMQDHVKTC